MVMTALVAGAGLGFAYARANDAQPPALQRAASSKVFLRAPYLLQPRTDSMLPE